jgi:ABC-2 type transport system ATP-binding protein
MTDIISTDCLYKSFGKVRAVSDLSLHVRESEIYGFLGLNGAGKTTTIRMLLGMIKSTSGDSFLFDSKVRSDSHHLWDKIGYLVEIPYSYPDLTVRENLEIIRRLRFISNPGSVDRVIERMQLGSYADKLAKNLSLGNAQRLGLAKALIHEPQMLILDEPANGLDPAGIVEVRELLKDLALNQGVTIFISSHILGEVSKFAGRIGIIHEGRLIQEVDSDKLEKLLRRKLLLKTRNPAGAKSALQKKGYSVRVIDKEIMELKDKKALMNPDAVATILVRAGYPPVMLKTDEEDLESYFLRVIGTAGGGQ